MSIASDLIDESSITQIIYDANKSSSLLLSGTEIILQSPISNEIKINASGITYNTVITSWTNITNDSVFIKSLTQPSNVSTLNINNTLQIQNGETSISPTQNIIISSNNSGNRIAIDGDYGLSNQILTSGGINDDVYWGTGGSLGDILTNGNIANMSINMNNYGINNISSLTFVTTPIPVSELTLTRLAFPITIDGELYYLPLYRNI